MEGSLRLRRRALALLRELVSLAAWVTALVVPYQVGLGAGLGYALAASASTSAADAGIAQFCLALDLLFALSALVETLLPALPCRALRLPAPRDDAHAYAGAGDRLGVGAAGREAAAIATAAAAAAAAKKKAQALVDNGADEAAAERPDSNAAAGSCAKLATPASALAVLGFAWRLAVDLLCVLPLDLWAGPAIAASFVSRGWPVSKAAYMAALPRLFKLVRLSKARRLGGGTRRTALGVAQIVLDITLVAHFYTCFFCWTTVVPFLGNEPGERDGAPTFWMSIGPPQFPSYNGGPPDTSSIITDPALPSFVAASTRYITMLYFICWMLLCVGVGDMKAVTQSERLLATVVMFTGGIVLALTIGAFTSLMQFLTAGMEASASAARELQQWMEARALPLALRNRVSAASAAQAPSRHADELTDGASPLLREAVLESLYAPLARGVPLLRDVLAAHPPSCWALAAALRPAVADAGEALLREGDAAEQLLVVVEGRIDLTCRDPRIAGAGPAPIALVDGAVPAFVVGRVGRGGTVGLRSLLPGSPEGAAAAVAGGFERMPLTAVATMFTNALVLDASVLADVLASAPPGVEAAVRRHAEAEGAAVAEAKAALAAALGREGDADQQLAFDVANAAAAEASTLASYLAHPRPRAAPRLLIDRVVLIGDGGGARLVGFTAVDDASAGASGNSAQPIAASSFDAAAAEDVPVPTLRLPLHSAASLRAAGVALAPAARAFTANALGSLLPPWTRALLLGRAAEAPQEEPEEAVETAAALAARGIMLQESALRLGANILLGLLVAYVAVAVPLSIGFSLPDSAPLATFNRIVDAFFWLDMLMTARTAERASAAPSPRRGRRGDSDASGAGGAQRSERHAALAHDVRQTDPGALLAAYLRGSFLVDLIATLPWDAIILGALSDDAQLRPNADTYLQQIPLLLRLLRLLRLVRILRLMRLGALSAIYEQLLVRFPVAVVLTSATAQIYFVMHLLACFWVFCIVNSDDSRPWWDVYIYSGPGGGMGLNPSMAGEQTVASKYLAAIYWSVSMVTTTGVGDLFPVNDPQRAYNAGAIVVGVVFFAYIVGILTSAMTATTQRAAADAVASVDRAARAARLPAVLRDRLVAYRQRRIDHFTPLDEAALLAALPFTLRKEVALALHCRSPVPGALAGGGAAAGWRALREALGGGGGGGGGGAQLHVDTQLIFECSSAAAPRWLGVGEAACWRGGAVDEVLVVADGELRPLPAAEDDEDEAETEAEASFGSGGSGGGSPRDSSGVDIEPRGARRVRRPSCKASDRLFRASLANAASSAAPLASDGGGSGGVARVVGLAAAADGAAAVHSSTLVAARPTLLYAVDVARVRELAARFPRVAAAVAAAAAAEAEAPGGEKE